jgi:hypothetical protein
MGDALRPLLHEAGILVDGEHLSVETVELAGRRGAEAAEADHEHRGIMRNLVNQRSASLLLA